MFLRTFFQNTYKGKKYLPVFDHLSCNKESHILMNTSLHCIVNYLLLLYIWHHTVILEPFPIWLLLLFSAHSIKHRYLTYTTFKNKNKPCNHGKANKIQFLANPKKSLWLFLNAPSNCRVSRKFLY